MMRLEMSTICKKKMERNDDDDLRFKHNDNNLTLNSVHA